MPSETLPNIPIPVIDFTKEDLKKPGSNSWVLARNEVRQALEEYGLFVALYDKFPWELINSSVFSALEELFDVPTENKIQNISPTPYFGYIGQLPILPIYESLAIEDATALEAVQSFSKLMWPSGNDQFCKTLHSYLKLVSGLEQMVCRMVFESYGVEKYFDSHMESISYLLRAQKYKAPDQLEGNQLGLPSHTDKSFLSLLHQNQVNGLRVKSKDGNNWIDVEFPPSSFVVMAGVALSVWSNNRIHSAVHQVTMTGNKDRYSLGLFSHHMGIFHIPEELVDDQHPLQFKPFDNLGFIRFFSRVIQSQQVEDENAVKAYCGI